MCGGFGVSFFVRTRLAGPELTANLFLLVLLVFDRGHVQGRLVREHEPVRDEVAVARVQDRVEHRLVQEEVAHPLGDDDVDLVDGEDHLFHLALDQRDGCRAGFPGQRVQQRISSPPANQTHCRRIRWRRQSFVPGR